MTTILGIDLPANVNRRHLVTEAEGDLLYFSSVETLAAGGSDSTKPLPALWSSVLGLPLDNGTFKASKSGDVATIQNDAPAGEFHLYGAGGGLVIDKDGDLSPDSPNARRLGYENFEWLEVASYVIGLKPGGTPSKNGDLVAVDTGLAIELHVQDSYAGGTKRLLDDLISLSGDVSGAYNNVTVTKLQGQAVDSSTPGEGDVLTFGAMGQWTPQALTVDKHITVALWSFTNTSGAWQITTGNCFGGGWLDNLWGGANDGDQADFTVYLTEGSYTAYLVLRYTSNSGILEVRVGGGAIGSVDTYAGLAMSNQITALGFDIAAPGWYTLALVLNGQNPSSGGYQMYVQGVALVGTAP